jgi:hypothetical protein
MAKNRKLRSWKALRRGGATRQPYDRVLIVCEGEKTERNYFDEIRRKFRISAAHIRVIPSEGTDPKSVVNFAEEEFNRNGKGFEKVYAVFDHDDHDDYANAIHMAEAKDKKLKNDEKQPVAFEAIVSVPCFALWLLLHFSDIQFRIHRDNVFRQLKVHIPEYAKGMSNVFGKTESNLEVATAHATVLKSTFQRIQGEDPYTDVHELVEVLLRLGRSARSTP